MRLLLFSSSSVKNDEKIHSFLQCIDWKIDITYLLSCFVSSDCVLYSFYLFVPSCVLGLSALVKNLHLEALVSI